MAAFWRPLKKLVEESPVNVTSLSVRLGLSTSAVSEMLNGRRAKAPDWDIVRKIVTICHGLPDSVRGDDEASDVEDELRFWRRRLEELEASLAEAPTTRRRSDATVEVVQASCRICADAYEDERYAYPEFLGDGALWAFGFQDACVILAGPDSALRAEAEVLELAVLETNDDLLAFRDECQDIVKGILKGIGDTVRRACHPHRVRLLHAAHTVVVVDSFIRGPVLDLVRRERGEIVVGEIFTATYADGVLAAAPMPVADVPYTDHRARVVEHYSRAAAMLALNVDEIRNVPDRFVEAGTQCAARYEACLGALAAECAELFVWASLQDGADAVQVSEAVSNADGRRRLEDITRGLHDQRRGLHGLETLLRALARKSAPGAWPAQLSKIYRRDLARPISPVGETPHDRTGPQIPSLDEGYVNPAFRTAVYQLDDSPHVDMWWRARPLRQEIQGFLAGHLSAFPTANRPMLILGDPGSGKSLLTRILAARLPPSDYLPIRIELRNVEADAGILDQVATALRRATLKRLDWATVTESAPDVLPVLIFDGFDELLQAGGADHWQYLQNIAAFQKTSADNGRPVAAIITSRTVVADQAAIPEGSLLIRLEPFDAKRINLWVDAWNEANRGSCTDRCIAQLPGDMGERHPELASQPLLLMMLALYYAVEGRYDSDGIANLSRVELYEKLMQLFVRRQIAKLDPGLRPDILEDRVETELDYLSVIAIAMFNRARQGVTAEEADHDLVFLRMPGGAVEHPEARLLFGRFFFIHEAKATFSPLKDRRWYEFLHATFGEYLVARKIATTLKGCADDLSHVDLLFGLLSFAPLTDREQILSDLRILLPSTKAVPELFRRALLPKSPAATEYSTGDVAITYRHACFSANLLLLELAVRGTIRFSEFVAQDGEPAQMWRRHTTLWQSQFTASAWDAFTRSVMHMPFPLVHGVGSHDIAVRLGHEPQQRESRTGAAETAGADSSSDTGRRWGSTSMDETIRRARALGDSDMQRITETLSAAYTEFGFAPDVVWADRQGRPYSPEQVLMALLACDPKSVDRLTTFYDGSVDVVSRCWDHTYAYFLIRKLARDLDGLPPGRVEGYLTRLNHDKNVVGSMGHLTRVSLLACSVRLLSVRRTAGIISVIETLAGIDLAAAPPLVQPDSFLTWMLTRAQEEKSDEACLRLLLLGAELRLSDWCARRSKILLSVPDGMLRGIPAHHAEYLHASVAAHPKLIADSEQSDLAVRVRAVTERVRLAAGWT